MIDQEVVSLADRRLNAILTDRADAAYRQIGDIKARFSAAGSTGGSRMLLSISVVYEGEISIQGSVAWQCLLECITAASVKFGPEEGEQAKEWILQKLVESAEQMKSAWHKDRSLNLTKLFEFEPRIEEAVRRAVDKTSTDIDLLALASERTGVPNGVASGIVINNSGIIQGLQFGAGSVANISQSITQADQKVVLDALATVRTAMEALDAAQHPGKNDVLGLIAELDAEAGKEHPNRLKIASGLSAIGQSISTVAALKPAYDSIKGVAAFFGVNLP